MSPTPGTPTARSTRSILATSPVWLVGVLAAVAAAIVTELFALGARAIGVPMEAGSLDADTAAPIPLGGFAMGTLMWSVVGIILAVCPGAVGQASRTDLRGDDRRADGVVARRPGHGRGHRHRDEGRLGVVASGGRSRGDPSVGAATLPCPPPLSLENSR